ncbi:IS30 family transposase, partial [Exilibacterium tricleocarpae]
MKHPNPMTEPKKAVIWEMWRRGDSMAVISQTIAKPSATVFSYLRYHGGIEPAERHRPLNGLSIEEREVISRGIASGKSLRSIAASIDRSPSTVSREISRNGGIHKYRAVVADNAARKRARRPKLPLLAKNLKLKQVVTSKLSEDWSPEQISGWLKIQFLNDESMRVSHETIYKSLFIQTRGLFRKEMRNHLRTKRKFRHSKNHKVSSRGQIVDGVSISERPADVEDRAIPGHWEGDLIAGSENSYIATVVERASRFTVLVKVSGKKTDQVVSALSRQMSKLPALLRQSLTWDRGTELASHASFTVETNMDVYFCDPSSPWQRGTNENTNGLLRQYFPKGTYLSDYPQSYLNKIASKLNNRPRKTLGYRS